MQESSSASSSVEVPLLRAPGGSLGGLWLVTLVAPFALRMQVRTKGPKGLQSRLDIFDMPGFIGQGVGTMRFLKACWKSYQAKHAIPILRLFSLRICSPGSSYAPGPLSDGLARLSGSHLKSRRVLMRIRDSLTGLLRSQSVRLVWDS